MASQIEENARYWASSATFDNSTRNEIAKLLESNHKKELADRFYKDLDFGTGGLRGIIGAGTARINIYNIKKATTAFSEYLKKEFKDEKEIRVAISFDSRKYSREFATATASVFAYFGIKCFIAVKPLPVPMLSFMVRHYDCHGGVCITASHNPPEYNGYKVYWQTGGQIVPPHDKEIINLYKSITSYDNLKSESIADAKKSGLIVEVERDFEKIYFSKIRELSLSDEGKDNIVIAYSPLHGTGAYPVGECLKEFGFTKVHMVEAQKEPDGRFPTVDSPNPEDEKAMQMVLELAKAKKADLALATDPDSDRVGVAVFDDNRYALLNGNEIVCLLTEYILSQRKKLDNIPSNGVIIKTIVTTDLLREIASHYNLECLDTLTGFKWIADLIEKFETSEEPSEKKKFICGGEESYGFLCDTFIRDKDAVMACALISEMVAFYKSKGKTLVDVLDDLYERHGIFKESLKTFSLPGQEGSIKITEIMQNLREKPPLKINGKIVKTIRDLSVLNEVEVVNGTFCPPQKIDLPSSNVLQFLLEDDSKISIRPSGTEPKIKFYFSIREPLLKGFQREEYEVVKKRSHKRLESLSDNFLALIKSY